MQIEMIVAVAENGVIGHDGKMPWRLSTDLKRFKKITMGLPIIMGRHTWESLPGVLPGRLNIIITRSKFDLPEGVIAVNSPEVLPALSAGLLDQYGTLNFDPTISAIPGREAVMGLCNKAVRHLCNTLIETHEDGIRQTP